MPVHRQTLSFDLSPSHRTSLHPSPLQAVIKSTLEQQIHQHVRVTPSLQHALKARTKKILSIRNTSPLGTKADEQSKEQRNRGSTTMGRSRRQWRVNQTKKQLQLLNQLYRSIHKDKVKRYCEEIQQQQLQLHMALAQNQLRKTLNPSTARPPKLTHMREIKTSEFQIGERSSRAKSQKERQLDLLFDRLSPYRRIQVTRYRAKDLLQPWQVNNLN